MKSWSAEVRKSEIEVQITVNSPLRVLEARKWEDFDKIAVMKCLMASLRGGEVTIN